MEEHGSSRRVACLAFIKSDAYAATRFDILERVEGEQHVLDASDFARRNSPPVLPRIL